MCLILFNFRQNTQWPLMLAANRDEAYARPTLGAHFWPSAPHLLAGKDLKSGGTWLGITRQGRFAAITNCHTAQTKPQASRGHLVRDYLLSGAPPKEYAAHTNRDRHLYAGFSLLLGAFGAARPELYYVSNGGDEMRALAPGNYALGNRGLDSNEPRNQTLLRAFDGHQALPDAELFALMHQDLGGPPTHKQRDAFFDYIYTSPFVRTQDYGTRATSILRMGHHRAELKSIAYHRTGWQTGIQHQRLVYG